MARVQAAARHLGFVWPYRGIFVTDSQGQSDAGHPFLGVDWFFK